MNILIAPDSFKGSLSARAFCDTAKRALIKHLPDADIDCLPIADGGEGTVESFVYAGMAEKILCRVHDPLGREMMGCYAYQEMSKTAIIEMASASGLPLLTEAERDPFHASSFGTGELILAAIEKGAKKLIIGLGGSATQDAAAGCLSALGFHFLNAQGNPIASGAQGLLELAHIKQPSNFADFAELDIQLACDICNPLFGEQGAAYIFSPQKGGKPENLAQLDQALQQFATCVQTDLSLDIASLPGGGAAGGMGAGLQLIGGRIHSGFSLLANALGLPQKLQNKRYDWVITGEGCFNNQSQFGKVPVAVAQLVKQYQPTPVIAIVGAIEADNDAVYQQQIDAIFSLCHRPESLAFYMRHAEDSLLACIENVVKILR